MAANPAADRGERVWTTGVTVGFLVPALRNQRHIAAGLRVNRTGLHAGEVRLQPVQVNEFCLLLTQIALHSIRNSKPCADRAFAKCSQ